LPPLPQLLLCLSPLNLQWQRPISSNPNPLVEAFLTLD
jgi:hypothetical protein